jgi:hypothetical protein
MVGSSIWKDAVMAFYPVFPLYSSGGNYKNHETPRVRRCPRRQLNLHFLNESLYLFLHAVVNFNNRYMSLEVLKAADI